MAKLALVTWLAYSLAKKAEKVKTFTVGFLPHLLVAGVFMFLCMKQPDFGSSVVLLCPHVHDALRGGREGRLHPRRLHPRRGLRRDGHHDARVPLSGCLAWLNMEQHKGDLAYQPFQSVMSFGSGGTWGTGIGKGLQTLYLPEAHNDFIAAIIGGRSSASSASSACIVCFTCARGARCARGVPRAQ